jgi:hypothetical protein
MTKTFAEYKIDGASWITLATGEYYPDILSSACELYKPILSLFGLFKRCKGNKFIPGWKYDRDKNNFSK